MRSKYCNTDKRSAWNARGSMSKNKPHLVTFHENILVSQWTFQLTLVHTKLFIKNGESKVLQYFGNVGHNLAALDAFSEVVKLTNHIRLWDTKLIWYFPSGIHWIYHDLKHHLRIHSFQQNFVNHLLTVINCVITSCTTNDFWLFHWHYGQIWIHKSWIRLHTYLYGFQLIHRVKQCTVYDSTTTTPILPTIMGWIASFTWYKHCKVACIKIIENLTSKIYLYNINTYLRTNNS